MEKLTSNDTHFLVALLASEEAPVLELRSDFHQWAVECGQVQEVLVGLVTDGTIGVTKPEGDEFHDFEKNASLELIRDWDSFVQSPYQLFLTDPGYRRWETDDWGISTERARYLMFSNQGSSIRV
ncbi:hypothetical protein [Ferrimonas balearica]|uniref:hypothetical protein n=1 Tax=Ferrimonas balearica TaxID=44012 RepID=UPI001C990610|nr:hypothetical protein [Ferrimonas balearica]MBY5991740.1 hypothetical protein [Ferrimonas balearica]